MKKIILVLVLAGVLGAGTYYWRNSGGKAQETTVTLAKVERGPLKQIVQTTGKVVSNLDVEIKCKASGTVVKLPFDVSDSVKEGDLLVELDPVDMQRNLDQQMVQLDASKARLKTAEHNLAVAERNLRTDRQRAEAALKAAEVASRDARNKADRVQQLYEKKLASEEERDSAETAATQALMNLENARIKLEELKTQELALEVQRQNVNLAKAQVAADEISLNVAKDRLNDCVVKAPMDGVVTDRKVQTGMIIASGVSNVGGGTTIMTLSDLSRIFVLASVDESDIGKVEVGQPATILVDAYPSMQFAGKVVRIASKGVNTQNVVTFEVKIEVLGAIKPVTVASAPSSRPDRAERAGREDRGGREGRAGRGEGRGPRDGRGPRQARAATQTRPGDPDSRESMAQRGPAARDEILTEKKNLLKPEMTATIDIVTAERDDVLLIPVLAVSRQAGGMYANVPPANPQEQEYDRTPVELGINDGLNYELLAGLNEGDTVVIRGEAESRWSAGQRGPGGRGMGASGSAGAMRVMRMGSRGGGR